MSSPRRRICGPRCAQRDRWTLVRRALRASALAGLMGAAAVATSAQTATRVAPPPTPPPDFSAVRDPGPIFRVFLTDGRALASYGECAVVGDRVVFTLAIGDGGLGTEYQLMSLPASAVDLDRTTSYRDAVRGWRYATTRGETDYTAITAEVSRSLDELSKIADPARRLAAAEEAKRRLVAWSETNYHYRAKDIQDLAALFDDVIAQLRVASGGANLSFSFVAGPAAAREEPIRVAPSLRESIELALAAATLSDVSTDRAAILRAAAAVSAGATGVEDLSAEVSRRRDEDRATQQAYVKMREDALARAHEALAKGDVAAVDAVRRDVIAREGRLAARRPDDMQALLRELDNVSDDARAHRVALDHYARVRPQLLAYERAVRPALSALDGGEPVLQAIRDVNGPGLERLERYRAHLARLTPQIAAIKPPADVADVHATLLSALRLAIEACKRRLVSVAANNMSVAREASASASGAKMLTQQARESLVKRLYPPQAR
jgi:hypothetical protein